MNNEICLSDLGAGCKAAIVRIKGESPFKKRLMEMGLIREELIKKVKLAPLADPAEYVIKGYHVSLRNDEARDIIVRIVE